MEMSQGNFLFSYFNQNCHFFLLQNHRREGQNRSCLWGLLPVGGEKVRKGHGAGKYSANTMHRSG
jgi:hypothetical protein